MLLLLVQTQCCCCRFSVVVAGSVLLLLQTQCCCCCRLLLGEICIQHPELDSYPAISAQCFSTMGERLGLSLRASQRFGSGIAHTMQFLAFYLDSAAQWCTPPQLYPLQHRGRHQREAPEDSFTVRDSCTQKQRELSYLLWLVLYGRLF